MNISNFYLILCLIGGFHICKADTNSDSPSVFDKFSEATLSEDGKLNFTGLATKYGQIVEQFDVQTEDGYILTLFHVTGENVSSNKTPILLLHGIFDSSDTFLIRGKSSMVVTLAARGYDVWIGNSRGNLYGRRHVSLDPDTDEEFWDYSFHEIGYYDLPAHVDFVRHKTGFNSIFYIGHSQGTCAHFVLTSLRPKYNERIKLFIALAPIAYLNNLKPTTSAIAVAIPAFTTALAVANINEVFRNHSAISDITTLVCSKGIVSYVPCGFGIIFPLFGYDLKGLEEEFITGVVFGHYPRATSRKSIDHFDQLVLRKSFAQYDYGTLKNLATYGRESPPEYDLSSVMTKVALFVGRSDTISTVKDVEHLRDSLPNVVHYEVMKPKQWNHVDFVWGKDSLTNEHLYPVIFELLEKYN